MATFNLTSNAWTEIIASGGSSARQVQPRFGRVMVNIGSASDVGAFELTQLPVNYPNMFNVRSIPAGQSVFARAINSMAIASTDGE